MKFNILWLGLPTLALLRFLTTLSYTERYYLKHSVFFLHST
jgi:hypothetical protein